MSAINLPVVGSNVYKSGTLASTAATANQVIVTYTVTTGKSLFLTAISANVRLTTAAATPAAFGTASFQVNGVSVVTFTAVAGAGVAQIINLGPCQPLAFASGDVVQLVCTPSATTPFTWDGAFIGFEQ